MTTFTHTEKVRTVIASLAVFLFSATYFNEWYNITSALLLIVALVSIKGAPRYNTKLIKLTAILFAIHFFVLILSVAIDTGDINKVVKSAEYPLKNLLLVTVAWTVFANRVDSKFYFYSLTIGSLIGLGISSYDMFVTGVRGFDYLMPIQKGNAAILFATLAFAASFYTRATRPKLSSVCLIGANFGLAASLLSLSRGGWILAPFLFVLPVFVYRKQVTKIFTAIAICSLLLTSVIVSSQSPSISNRISQASQEAASETGSFGVRIELWKNALHNFYEKPMLGWGKEGLQPQLDKQNATGELSNFARSFNGNAHSAYLNALSQRGIFGFAGLLCLMLGPGLIYLTRLVKGQNEEERFWALSGGIHILSTAGFCVSQDHFLHNEGVVLYAVTNAIILGFLVRAQGSTESTETTKV